MVRYTLLPKVILWWVAWVSALMMALAMSLIKILSRTESVGAIVFYMVLILTPASLVPALFVWSWPSTGDLALLVLLGLFGGCGQFCVSQSLKYAETHVAMPFDYVRLVWVSISGYVIFGDVPDAFVWGGGSLIFASTAYITIREHQRRRRITAEASGAEVIR